MTGRSGRIAKGLLVTVAVAGVSFSVSMVLQQGVGRLVSRFFSSLAPPRWWWYSPLPWPQTLLAAALFAAVAFLLSWIAVRSGVALPLLVCGAFIGIGVAWGWDDLRHLGALDFLRVTQNLRWLWPLESLHVSAAAGTAVGVVAALFAPRRRTTTVAVGGQHLTSAST
jgi:hypothetical protein